MPHQCVRCGKLYPDGNSELLTGCTCGAKLFFFVKKQQLEEKQPELILSNKERKRIERDVKELMGVEHEDRPVILDLESIYVKQSGQYELDLTRLFRKEDPLVYKLEDGKYIIDLAQSFTRMRKDK